MNSSKPTRLDRTMDRSCLELTYSCLYLSHERSRPKLGRPGSEMILGRERGPEAEVALPAAQTRYLGTSSYISRATSIWGFSFSDLNPK